MSDNHDSNEERDGTDSGSGRTDFGRERKTHRSESARKKGRKPSRPMPDYIGRYKIESLLGQGGMGAVFLAEQQEPVRRTVAIKLTRAAIATPVELARFEGERNALARLSHPNIAAMFDADTTEDGLPYFVMEHVDGPPITTYCESKQLSIDQRLELFIQVCRGVQFAHQKGIIHRDIKPSNILVTEIDGVPVPKIIDFGIAKAIDQPLSDATLMTPGATVGTPAYMSPEALRMVEGDVDTRSDVYALGLILYELLIRLRPIQLEKPDLRQFLRELERIGVRPPSQVLRGAEPDTKDEIAKARRSTSKELESRIDGDLNWITAKATAREKEDRYDSAAALLDDIQKHLANEPVTARPPTWGYQASKFVRRHRAGVVAAALTVLALLLGTIGTTIGMINAKRAEARATHVSEFLTGLFDSANPWQSQSSDLTARELLLRGAERIETQLDEEPSTKADLLTTIGLALTSLGENEEGVRLLRESLRIRTELYGPRSEEAVDTLHHLGVRVSAIDPDESIALLRQVLDIRIELFGEEHPSVARAMSNLASRLDDEEEARHLFRRSIEISQASNNDGAAGHHAAFGTWLANRRELEEAEQHLRAALEIRKRNGDEDSYATLRVLDDLATTLGIEGKIEESIPVLEEILPKMEEIMGSDHARVAHLKNNLGVAYRETGQLDRSEAYFLDALRIMRANDVQGRLLAHPITDLAVVYWHRGELEKAEAGFLEALEIWRVDPGPDHPWNAWPHWGLGNVYRDQGRFDEAETHYERALEIREATYPPGHWEIRQTVEEYAKLLDATNRPDEARSLKSRYGFADVPPDSL